MNAALVLEIAVLILVSFLSGAVIGALARWLLARPKPVLAAAAEVTTPGVGAATASVNDLVKAPAIAPLRTPPTAAERLAAAGGMSSTVVMPKVSLPQQPAIEPSRRAGETVSGRHIDNPEHPTPAADASSEPKPEEAMPVSAPTMPAPAETPQPQAPVALDPEPATESPSNVAIEADARLPVEERVEPVVAPDDLVLTDTPTEIAAELQDVIETEEAGVAPTVAAEAPLIEPVVERDQHEADEAIAEPIVHVEPDAAAPAAPEIQASVDAAAEESSQSSAPPVSAASDTDGDDELAAMRAIEGDWRPKRPAAARKPADLPEGVSLSQATEAAQAVEKSGAAVANALATAAAVLQEIGPGSAPGRPSALGQPRQGGKDDLGRIKGVAPAIESALNGLGIYHFDQIAGWDDGAVAWIETHFGFKGRIARERWQEQARELSAGTSAADAAEAAMR